MPDNIYRKKFKLDNREIINNIEVWNGNEDGGGGETELCIYVECECFCGEDVASETGHSKANDESGIIEAISKLKGPGDKIYINKHLSVYLDESSHMSLGLLCDYCHNEVEAPLNARDIILRSYKKLCNGYYED